jgi:putative spermidine/putrescine transport system permease protein
MTDKNYPISATVTVESILEQQPKARKPRRSNNFWSWIVFLIGMIYFFLPLVAVFEFSLRAKRGVYSFEAYRLAFQDPAFYQNFGLSLVWSVLTIIVSLLLIVPTAYWVHLRLPRWKPVVEFFTLMPFVVPAVVLVFGMARLYGRGLTDFVVSTPIALVAGYVVLSFPYIYRAVDAGLRSIDVRTLTEAAQSLGAGWPVILFQVIFPNLRVAILSGVFLTFAIVMGEFTFASLLSKPAFGVYMEEIGAMRAYTPQALAVVSFLITWLCIGLINRVARGAPGQGQIAGAR